MNRRDLMRASLLAAGQSAVAGTGKPAAGTQAYPGIAYRDYSRCFPDYLTSLVREACLRREERLAKLHSREAILECQRWTRETFWKMIGGMPERTPLNTRTVGSFERDGYRVEKLVYESFPGIHIPANLYIPTKAQPPFPGVLLQMGHSLNGKGHEAYQRCAQGLVKLGFLVLAFDPMGQGERTYYPVPNGWLTRLPSADDEHTVPGRQMLLAGDTATRLQVWDAVRSLDVLYGHPLVDRNRIGATGQSGGGTMSMFLATVDDRLTAVAVCSGNTENVATLPFNPPGSTDDAEQDLVGSGLVGFDRWDTLYPIAPKPLLVQVSAKDWFGTYSPAYIRDGWAQYQKLRQVYQTLGKGDHLAWKDDPLPHGMAYEIRMGVYEWLRRWLQPGLPPVEREPEAQPEKDQTLWVTSKGNVVKEFGGLTPFEQNRRHAASIVTPDRPKGLAEFLGVRQTRQDVRMTKLGTARSRGFTVEAVEVPTDEGVWAPAWLYVPEQGAPRGPLAVVLEQGGRNARWQEGGLLARLAEAGWLVCAPDLRAIGDLRSEYARGATRNAADHVEEEPWAWASLILGRPLLGQRIMDIRAVVQAVRRHTAAAGRRVVVAASGALSVPALFAAVLEPAIDELYMSGALVSLRDVVETEEYQCPLANMAQGLLAVTDLPQAARAVAPRKIHLAGTVSAGGVRLPVEKVRAQYPEDHVRVAAEADWSAAAIMAACS